MALKTDIHPPPFKYLDSKYVKNLENYELFPYHLFIQREERATNTLPPEKSCLITQKQTNSAKPVLGT